MAVVLIGNRDGILTHAGETLDELGITWAWGDVSEAPGTGGIVIVEQGAEADFEAAGCVVLRVPIDDESETPESKIQRLTDATNLGGGTLAIGKAGAVNAGLFAARVLAVSDDSLRGRLDAWVNAKRDAVLAKPDPSIE